jgi:hypothetical protein
MKTFIDIIIWLCVIYFAMLPILFILTATLDEDEKE